MLRNIYIRPNYTDPALFDVYVDGHAAKRSLGLSYSAALSEVLVLVENEYWKEIEKDN